MAELSWYYPESLSGLRNLLGQSGIVPHGGGTALLKRDLTRIQGLIDLSNMPYRDILVDHKRVHIGAIATYADVVRVLTYEDPGHILVQSLSRAGSTPLRNRFTVGGGIASFPVWSDLMGPLLALEADITLVSPTDEKTIPLTEYTDDPANRSQTLVTATAFDKRKWKATYHRETRTVVDYPAFTITVLADIQDSALKEIRIVLVGTTRKYHRLQKLEEELIGRSITHLTDIDISLPDAVAFPSRKHGSGEYLREAATVALNRKLRELAGRSA